MATIVTRETGATAKGSPLTNLELDNNFINLNTDKAEKTGSNATGTWDISISGNAATATTASNLSGFTNSTGGTPVSLASATNNGLYYIPHGSLSLFGQDDGAIYAQAYSTDWVHQIFGDYRSGQIAIRGKNNGTWQAWRTVLDSANYNSYAPTLTGTGASGTWGIGINTTGDFAIVNTTSGNGLTWYGRTGTKNATNDRAAFVGTYGANAVVGAHTATLSAWADLYVNTVDGSGGGNTRFAGGTVINTAGEFYAPITYDSNNTAYYVNPTGSTRLSGLSLVEYPYVDGGGDYINGWGQSTSAGGATAVGGFYPYAISVHTGLAFSAHSSYGGIRFYNQSYPSPALYQCALQLVNGYAVAPDSVRSPIFYDSNDTGYYTNQAGVSRQYSLALGNQGSLTSGTEPLSLYHSTRYLAAIRNSASEGYYPWLVNDYYNSLDALIFHFNGIGDRFCFNRGGTGYATNDFRAPIFYDSNNTGYYIDPNGTSVLAGLSVSNTISGSITGNAGTLNGYSSAQSGAEVILRTANNGYLYINNWIHPANGTGFFYDAGVHFYESGNYMHSSTGISAAYDFRAPVFYDSNDTGYYIDPNGTSECNYIRANRLLLDRNYGHSIFGVYSSTRYQGVWSMGQSWALPDDGTTTGNLYGLAWSHPNAGGVASNLNDHGLLVLCNGGFRAAISGSIRAASDIRAPIFYDLNDSSYYVDPSSSSLMYNLRLAGSLNIGDGNDLTMNYDQIYRPDGGAIYIGYSYANNINLNDGGGITTSATSFRAPIFYDNNNTGYYCDPNSTSNFNAVNVGGVSLSGDQSLASSGYKKLPGGLIYQWGYSGGTATISYPITFPNAVFFVIGQNVSDGKRGLGVSGVSRSSFYGEVGEGGYGTNQGYPFYWSAWGY